MKIHLPKTACAMMTALATFITPISADACTSFLLKGNDGGFVYGRTMEFGMDLQSRGTVIPRGLAFQGVGTDGKSGTGLPWTSRYAAVGANGIGLPILVDGMNEKGLAGGMLYAPNTARYQDVSPADSKTSIASYQMLVYALTNFATVDEVREGFGKIKVNRSPHPAFNGVVPLHMTLHDASGKSIVIEYADGQLKVFDNPTSVLTNDPTFDWHLANLGNYLNLRPTEAAPIKVGSLTIQAPSSGSGLHGMPGDVLSPSRFIRAFIMKEGAPTTNSSAQQVGIAFHILNNFDIPPGSVQLSAANPYGGGSGGYERTEWTSVADLKNLVFYIKTFDNQTLRALDLKNIDVSAKDIRYFDLAGDTTVIDLVSKK